MKRIISSIITVCILLMSFCNICYAAEFQTTITAQNGTVGDTITVTVSIPANTNAAGGSLNLVYDNTKMELVDATAGSLISAFSKTVNKNYDVNKIRVNFAGSETVSSSGGAVLNATFKLTAAGTATFSTEKFKLADLDTNYLTCADTSKDITISGEVTTIPVTKVTLDKTTLSISKGNKQTLTATVSPATATNKSVTWKSSNTSVATVSNGIVTAVKAGTATITATTVDGGYTAKCTVTVTENSTAPSMELSVSDGCVGETVTVAISVNECCAAEGNLVYDNTKMEYVSKKSYNSTTINESYKADTIRMAYSTIDNTSEVIAEITFRLVNPGTAVFKLNGTMTYVTDDDIVDEAVETENSITITSAGIAATGVTLNKSTLSLLKGGSETLTATVIPTNATNKTVTWTSSDISVATISNGTVTALKAGTATITATTADGGYTASCVVTVTEKVVDENAPTIKISDIKAKPGKEIQVTVELKNNTGFASMGIEVGYNSDIMTLTNVTSNSGVGGTFTKAQYYTVNPYNMGWDSVSNIAYNGNLATLTFAVNENAADGVYPITVDYYKGVNGNYVDGVNINYDENFDAVGFVYVSGNVVVASYVPGDVNGDEFVDNKDATYLLRYLAGWNLTGVVEDALDVDGSTVVDNKDATILLRYLAGWNVTLH